MSFADHIAQQAAEGRMSTDELRTWLDRPSPKPELDPAPDERPAAASPALPEVVRVVCSACMRPGSECARCNGTGYELKRTYGVTAGEQGVDENELD